MKNVYKVLGVGYDETYNTKEGALNAQLAIYDIARQQSIYIA